MIRGNVIPSILLKLGWKRISERFLLFFLRLIGCFLILGRCTRADIITTTTQGSTSPLIQCHFLIFPVNSSFPQISPSTKSNSTFEFKMQNAKLGKDNFELIILNFELMLVELNVQTWVIAPPEHQGWDAAAQIKKIWPEREPLCRLTPDEFNLRLDRLLTKHCQG